MGLRAVLLGIDNSSLILYAGMAETRAPTSFLFIGKENERTRSKLNDLFS